jgi:hypothetical protein
VCPPTIRLFWSALQFQSTRLQTGGRPTKIVTLGNRGFVGEVFPLRVDTARGRSATAGCGSSAGTGERSSWSGASAPRKPQMKCCDSNRDVDPDLRAY